MLIVRRRRPRMPGVEDAFWQESTGCSAECVVAWVGVADSCWLELADVVICPSGLTIVETLGQVYESLTTLPGSTVVAAEWGCHAIALMRTGHEISLCAPTHQPVEDYALLCYSRVVSSG